jgi:hypothetical protein
MKLFELVLVLPLIGLIFYLVAVLGIYLLRLFGML